MFPSAQLCLGKLTSVSRPATQSVAKMVVADTGGTCRTSTRPPNAATEEQVSRMTARSKAPAAPVSAYSLMVRCTGEMSRVGGSKCSAPKMRTVRAIPTSAAPPDNRATDARVGHLVSVTRVSIPLTNVILPLVMTRRDLTLLNATFRPPYGPSMCGDHEVVDSRSAGDHFTLDWWPLGDCSRFRAARPDFTGHR